MTNVFQDLKGKVAFVTARRAALGARSLRA